MRRRPTTGPEHPDEEVLRMLAADAPVPAEVAAHVAMCASCTTRLDALRALRDVLHAVAAQEEVPPQDLVPQVLARLHARHTTLDGINEVVAALAALLRGLRGLAPHAAQESLPGQRGEQGS